MGPAFRSCSQPRSIGARRAHGERAGDPLKAQETSLLKQAGPQVPIDVLLKDSLRVLLLPPLLAMGFAVSARRTTPPLRQAPVLP